MQVPAHHDHAGIGAPPAVLVQFVRFWSGRHLYTAQPTPKLRWYVALWATAVGIGYFCALAAGVIIAASNGQAIENQVAEFVSTQSALKVIILTVIVAPFWEETAFRLPMSGVPWTMAVGGSFFAVLAIPSIFGFSTTPWLDQADTAAWIELLTLGAQLLCVAAIIFFATTRMRRNRGVDAQSEPSSRTHFTRFTTDVVPPRNLPRWTASVIFTVVFAAAHLSNFSDISAMTPVLVIPQLLLGAVIMFARVNHSWWLGLGIHAVNNLMVIGVALLTRQGEAIALAGGLGFLSLIGLACIASIMFLVVDYSDAAARTRSLVVPGGPAATGGEVVP